MSISNTAAAACICQNLQDEQGLLRAGVAKGLNGATSDTVVECFSKALDSSKIGDGARAVDLFAQLDSPKVQTRLSKLSLDTKASAPIRARSLQTVGIEEEYIDVALEVSADKDEVVQAAAISVLGEHTKNKDARRKILQNLSNSKALVRAASLKALKKHIPTKADEALCEAMLNDTDATVRKAAIDALYEVRRPEPIRCLRQKAFKLEEDEDVRDSLIKTLGSALGPGKKPAYKVLCDAMPFWLKSYIKDDVVDNLKGVGIVREHNRVDPANSPTCVKKAFQARSGYSCYAKMHIALWHNLTTGKDKKTALCPGMEEYSEMK